MKDSVKELLAKHYKYWESLKIDKSFYRMENGVIDDVEKAHELHYGVKPNTQRWCGSCVMELFTRIYKEYDSIRL